VDLFFVWGSVDNNIVCKKSPSRFQTFFACLAFLSRLDAATLEARGRFTELAAAVAADVEDDLFGATAVEECPGVAGVDANSSVSMLSCACGSVVIVASAASSADEVGLTSLRVCTCFFARPSSH